MGDTMSISLSRNLISLGIASSLRTTTQQVGSVYERLASGSRINKAANNPADAALAQQLNVQGRLMTVAIRNANDGLSYANMADAGLSEIYSILGRMSELSLQSANSTYSSSQRSALQSEFTALGSEVERIAAVTQFNGINALSASSDIMVQVGITSDGASRIALQSALATLSFLGLGSNYALTYSISGATTSYAVSASRFAYSAINLALGDILQQRGIIAAAANRLSSAVDYLSVARENTIAAEARVKDSDIASDAAELVRLQVLQQSQLSLLAQSNKIPTLVLKLLE